MEQKADLNSVSENGPDGSENGLVFGAAKRAPIKQKAAPELVSETRRDGYGKRP